MKTTVNGKEIKLFGTADISLMFTTIIQDYLNLGFIFNYAESARGTQGEDMKADLTKDGGKTVYRVYVNKHYEGGDTCVYIIVEKFTDCNGTSTLWQGQGKRFQKRDFGGFVINAGTIFMLKARKILKLLKNFRVKDVTNIMNSNAVKHQQLCQQQQTKLVLFLFAELRATKEQRSSRLQKLSTV